MISAKLLENIFIFVFHSPETFPRICVPNKLWPANKRDQVGCLLCCLLAQSDWNDHRMGSWWRNCLESHRQTTASISGHSREWSCLRKRVIMCKESFDSFGTIRARRVCVRVCPVRFWRAGRLYPNIIGWKWYREKWPGNLDFCQSQRDVCSPRRWPCIGVGPVHKALFVSELRLFSWGDPSDAPKNLSPPHSVWQ